MPLFTIHWLLFFAWLALLCFSTRAALRRRKSAAEPTCARCHYVVLGLTSSTCPECGANLRTSGIIPPGKISLRIGTAFLGSAVLLTGLILGATILGPLHQLHYEDCTVDLTLVDQPTTPTILLTLSASGYSRPRSPDHIDAYAFGPPPVPGATTTFRITNDFGYSERLVPDGPRATISCLPATASWRLTDPSRTITAPSLTAPDLNRLLTAIGCTSDLPRADELARIITASQSTTDIEHFSPAAIFAVWRSESGSSGRSQIPDPLLNLALAWSFAFLWAATLPCVLLHRAKPLRGRHAAPYLP